MAGTLTIQGGNITMRKSLFVISDLHLGGGAGFQMCSPAGLDRLAQFIRYVGTQREAAQETRLVIAGDIVDFLAEEEFTSFTNDDDKAVRKLQAIIDSTRPIWTALHDLVATGGRLTLMLGNHDIELSLPGPRRLLMQTLGENVEFLYDNQAFVEGSVLIEHGNCYDKWNVVSHDALREIRSALSRREVPIDYQGPPGSQMVQQVLNPLKAKYPWVDLLKPETSGMVPILAVLDPAAMKHVAKIAKLAAKSMRSRFDENGIPTDPGNIRAEFAQAQALQDPMIQLAMHLADMDDLQNISFLDGASDLLTRLKEATYDAVTREIYARLLQALRSYANDHRQAFDSRTEIDEYLKPAQAAARRGFEVVVYGHTHLAKRVALDVEGAVYLNTGTWADLLRVPETVLADDDTAALAQLRGFVADLATNKLESWRCQLPTFARIDLDGAKVTGKDVFVFEPDGAVSRLPQGPLTLLTYSRGE
ncbi:Calcineurin-like phosphoesterase [Roseateles sp. YR242]|uniref:metallophosphoesterase n=1 Tax=Roseateles sp. YR242 TaxID=1855305 RepID=UPI0008D76307|nr:metallophosphoesterase [Roseateles sp. YR242]SEK29554.1 Calcineurin-like phosphoesterase [Roseateles sp. YR242]